MSVVSVERRPHGLLFHEPHGDLRLPIRPGVFHFGSLVLDAEGDARLGERLPDFSPVVREDSVDAVRAPRDQGLEKRDRVALVLPGDDHEEQELRCPVDGDEEVLPRHSSSQDRQIREIDVEEPREVLGELPDGAERLWERGEAIAGEDPVGRDDGQVREVRYEELDTL